MPTRIKKRRKRPVKRSEAVRRSDQELKQIREMREFFESSRWA